MQLIETYEAKIAHEIDDRQQQKQQHQSNSTLVRSQQLYAAYWIVVGVCSLGLPIIRPTPTTISHSIRSIYLLLLPE